MWTQIALIRSQCYDSVLIRSQCYDSVHRLDLERELRDPPSKAGRVTFHATSLQQIKTSAKAKLSAKTV